MLFSSQTLPTWLQNLDKVVLLDLDSNEFNGTIPTEIGNMISLDQKGHKARIQKAAKKRVKSHASFKVTTFASKVYFSCTFIVSPISFAYHHDVYSRMGLPRDSA